MENNNHHQNISSSMGNQIRSIQVGYRFLPSDCELITYLKKKVINQLSRRDNNDIRDVNIYKEEPEELTDKWPKVQEDEDWYFFTSRQRKYPKGSRPDRSTPRGYWKPTGRDKTIMDDENGTKEVGFKKSLDYYQGRPSQGTKTDWKMHEYRLKGVETTTTTPAAHDPNNQNHVTPPRDSMKKKKGKLENEIEKGTAQNAFLNGNNTTSPPAAHDPNNQNHVTPRDSMKLGDLVLCRIYKKRNKPNNSDHDENNQDSQEAEASNLEGQLHQANPDILQAEEPHRHHQSVSSRVDDGGHQSGSSRVDQGGLLSDVIRPWISSCDYNRNNQVLATDEVPPNDNQMVSLPTDGVPPNTDVESYDWFGDGQFLQEVVYRHGEKAGTFS